MHAISRPLHPINVNQSHYSSLAAAVPGAAIPRRPNRTIVPTGTLTPSGGRQMLWPRNTVVHFESAKGRGQEHGVSFSDIRAGLYHTSMVDPSCPVFEGVRQAHAEFRILWPGYRHMEYTTHLALHVNGHPVTRYHLALQIVDAYSRFFERARFSRYAGSHNENHDSTWVITTDTPRHHFVLKTLSNQHGHEAVFQAEIEIVFAH